ncbi:MAG TPA: hypothetical protein PK635_03900 [Actinomycetota bacterium]|nr:hypothetical protein [Actinomycetota bacterium]
MTMRGPLKLTLDELVDAAITVGTPNAIALFNNPQGRWETVRRVASVHSRLDLVKAPLGVPSEALGMADGSERGYASYELGMALTLAVARHRFGVADLAHYDAAYRDANKVGPSTTRPDLIDPITMAFVAEAKGSMGKTQAEQMTSAVSQLMAVMGKDVRQRTPVASGAAVCPGFQMAGGKRPKRLSVHIQAVGARTRTRAVSRQQRLAAARALSGETLLSTYGLTSIWLSQAAAGYLETGEQSYVVARDPVTHTWIGLDSQVHNNVRVALREVGYPAPSISMAARDLPDQLREMVGGPLLVWSPHGSTSDERCAFRRASQELPFGPATPVSGC